MCNQTCLDWGVKHLKPDLIKDKQILEVGSYNINGSLRKDIEIYQPKEYIGCDIAYGNDVDVICNASNLMEKFGKKSYDLVISCCALEHIIDWKAAISNMKGVCKEDGYIFIIVPEKWSKHSFPHDYWRYNEKDLRYIFADCKILVIEKKIEEIGILLCLLVQKSRFMEVNLTQYSIKEVL